MHHNIICRDANDEKNVDAILFLQAIEGGLQKKVVGKGAASIEKAVVSLLDQLTSRADVKCQCVVTLKLSMGRSHALRCCEASRV